MSSRPRPTREQQGFTGEARLLFSADMRYRGQSFEIETPLEKAWIESGDTAAMAGAFHREHERFYEHADPDAPCQIINQRLVIVGDSPKPQVATIEHSSEPPTPLDRMPVFFDGGTHEASLYRRADLKAGQRFAGPAVVLQDDCTTCVLGGFVGEVDAYGNLILTAEG
jgi:N-methylhydantoinase A